MTRRVLELREVSSNHLRRKYDQSRSLARKVSKGQLVENRTYSQGLIDALKEIIGYVQAECPLYGAYDEPDAARRIHEIVGAWYQQAINLGPTYNPYNDPPEGKYHQGKADAYGNIYDYVSPSGSFSHYFDPESRSVQEFRAWVINTIVPDAEAKRGTFRLTTSEGIKYKAVAQRLHDGGVEIKLDKFSGFTRSNYSNELYRIDNLCSENSWLDGWMAEHSASQQAI